ncbi:MAG: 2Fe-2S iron-sulfur cluster-binding protein, partial [Pseudomonadota bacterium]
MTKTPVQFRLNGMAAATFADPGANLLDVMRRGLGDLSAKYGCGQGTCGACTVLVDGRPRLACLTLAEEVE